MIREPTILEGDWIALVCAYMCMSNRIGDNTSDGSGKLRQSSVEPELSSVAFIPQRTCGHCLGTLRVLTKTPPTETLEPPPWLKNIRL